MRATSKIGTRILLAITLNTISPLTAANSEKTLSLDEVLNTSLDHTPQILEAIEKQRGKIGKQFAADGAFDSTFNQSSLFLLSGFYNGTYIDSSVTKPLRSSGATVYGGYRSGTGTFPIYEDEFITLNRGELNVGILFPLLRNRNFDEKRYNLRNSELDVQLAETDILLTQIQVQHNAMIAYWRWLAAGARLSVYQHLLEISEERDSAFSTLVSEGNLAEIALIENTQNVLKRRSFVARAQGELDVAALTLSLYYRDNIGTPQTPKPSQLPAEFPAVDLNIIRNVDKDINRALVRQAELNRIDIVMEQAKLQLRLGENLLKPKVDAGVKFARDLGDGRESSVGNDIIIELEISVPIGARKARGEIESSKAKFNELLFERQRVEEQLKANIKQLSHLLTASAELTNLAKQEVSQAVILEGAEKIREAEGASTFFVLNLREENTADARVRKIIAQLEYFEEVTNYYAATANTDAFHIDDL